MARPKLTPLSGYREYPPDEMRRRAGRFLDEMLRRRSVREFSDRAVPEEVLRDCLEAAASAPSGANRQPWHFVVVRDPEVKRRIREAAEREERDFYHGRAPNDWLEALEPLGTDEHKPFLETAPFLIAVFAQVYGFDGDGEKIKHYYVNESVGIAVGFLLAALQEAGLATLTHTPAPMRFLSEILGRPRNERPFLLIPVGYPAADARVPEIDKKSLAEVTTFV